MFATVQKWIQKLFLLAASVLILLWCIKPIRDRLGGLGWIDEAFVFAVIAIALTRIMVGLDKIETGVGRIPLSPKDTASQPELIEHGVAEVYKFLLDEMSRVPKKRDKTLKVIGLTLYTAWPNISTWLSKHDSDDWQIELCVLDPQFAKDDYSIPDKWVGAITSQLDAIEQFKHNNRTRFREITVYRYAFLPAVHGFLVGTGAAFVSFSHWHSTLRQIDDPIYFYEYFKSEDFSQRAKLHRELFNSWFERAKAPIARQGVVAEPENARNLEFLP